MIPALLGFLVFGVIGWFVKNLYPFSAYSMYASVARMRTSNVPMFWAEGQQARVSDFVAFSGIDPDEMMPAHTQCTLTWMVHEAKRWVREHPGDGQVEVAWGFVHVVIHEDGRVESEDRVVCRGRAARR